MGVSMAQQVADLLDELTPEERQAWIDSLPDGELERMERDWRFWARPEQLPPDDLEWVLWVLLGGRGSGKTRPGSEWVVDRSIAYNEAGCRRHRCALVARTAADVRDTMVEGETGLAVACERRGLRYRYEPSKRRFSIPSLRTVMTTFSAEEPDSLRGPQHHTGWCDEPAAWSHRVDAVGNTAWTNLMFGMRLDVPGHPELIPRVVATTTPKPIPLVKEWAKAEEEGDRSVRISRQTLYDNIAHLAPAFVATIVARYANSALAAQEILGMILDAVEGALWQPDRIDHVVGHPELARIVVGVDPPAEHVAECGIIVVGVETPGQRPAAPGRSNRHAYVLEDLSLHGPPEVWGAQVVAAAHRWGADVVAEVNNGGDMVRAIIHGIDPALTVRKVRAGKGQSKWARAEPVAAAYSRVHHVGYHPELESQMVTWTEGDPLSPDRMDALVWAMYDVLDDLVMPKARAATPTGVTLPRGAAAAVRSGQRVTR